MLLIAFVLAISGCSLADTAAAYVADHGSVFECRATANDVLELCTDLDESDLEAATGWDCWPTTRWWPRMFGCVYRCGIDASGCNAHHGCFCPESG